MHLFIANTRPASCSNARHPYIGCTSQHNKIIKICALVVFKTINLVPLPLPLPLVSLV